MIDPPGHMDLLAKNPLTNVPLNIVEILLKCAFSNWFDSQLLTLLQLGYFIIYSMALLIY